MDKRREKGCGCYDAVYEMWLHWVPCIAKRLHDILVGRGQEEPVSEEDRRAAISRFREECVLTSSARKTIQPCRDQRDQEEQQRPWRPISRDQRDQKDQETKGNLALEIREVSRDQQRPCMQGDHWRPTETKEIKETRQQSLTFWGQITLAKTSWQSTPRNQTQGLLHSRNSRSRGSAPWFGWMNLHLFSSTIC